MKSGGATMKKLRMQSRFRSTLLSGLLLVFVAALLLAATFLVRIKLLQNAQSMGMALAHSYALEEALNIQSLETNLDLASQFVDDIVSDGGDLSEIQQWLTGYFNKVTEIIGYGLVDFYAVIDGQLVAANPWEGWEGDASYPYQETDWYQDALDAEGAVTRGAVYTDVITGQKIFTISKALTQSGNVLAMDVYLENVALHGSIHSLPADYSYYLCDNQGTLLYAITKWDADDAQLQQYIDYMMAGIKDGSLLAYDAVLTDRDGEKRGVYYQTMDYGWTVILTIPIRHILMGEQNAVVIAIAILALILFLLLAVLTALDSVRGRRMKKADDTVHMLCDSFHSIYRVNLSDGTYEGLKIYQDLQDKVPLKGSYAFLLDAMRTVMKEETYRTFVESFSPEEIRARIDQGVADYGGDFQRRFGQQYRWVNIRTLYDRALARDVVILCFRDVDEEKRRELQNTLLLQDALDAAHKSTKAKNEFFSSMSHDMRTPLNAVLGCCDLAEKCIQTGSRDELLTYLHKIRFAGSQLLALINDILELSRMEAGKSHLDLRETNLPVLLEHIAGIFQDRAQAEGKDFQVNVAVQDALILADEKKITQIANNLLSNALKYTLSGNTIGLEVRQFPAQPYSKYQLVVSDTGIGMSPAFLKKLFEPYSRETTFAPRTTVGTGLGMSIVKSLVTQMNGEISVDSTLGRGTQVTVILPLKTVEPPKPAATPERPSTPAPFCWDSRRVLIAEDNEINREIMAEILKSLGVEVLEAVNGSEAVELFQASDPNTLDAILMDMQMPEMDGCTAADTIRGLHRPDASGVPILAVTANAFAEDIARTTAAGMNDHIPKPIDATLLCQTLQRWIRQWDQVREANRRDAPCTQQEKKQS